MKTNDINIIYLADRPDLIPLCAAWAFGLWGSQSNGSLDRASRRFSDGANKDRIPLTLLALAGEKPAGMISLWNADFDGREDLSPWLASLYVHPFHRGHGIASLLVARIESEARRLSQTRLHLVTEEAETLYTKAGWRTESRVHTAHGPAALMVKDL